jgi:phage/plasmid primase-like uncharacterized protein
VYKYPKLAVIIAVDMDMVYPLHDVGLHAAALKAHADSWVACPNMKLICYPRTLDALDPTLQTTMEVLVVVDVMLVMLAAVSFM